MNTINLRQRIPFKQADDESENATVLDDQEQEEMIQTLKDQNLTSNQQYLLALAVIVAASCMIQITVVVSPSRHNPLLAIFPSDNSVANMPIPLARLFALLSVAMHLNQALLIHPEAIQKTFRRKIRPLSYPVELALSSIAPIICLVLGRPWQTVIWWSLTSALVLFAHTVHNSIDMGTRSVLELEAMKYVAPGA